MLGGLITLVLSFGPYCDDTLWKRSGLDAPCALLNPARPGQHLATLMHQWSLNEAQARCALDAVNTPRRRTADGDLAEDADAWRRCVSQWPDSKPLWVGLIHGWDYKSLDGLIARLPSNLVLAQELYDLPLGPHGELALQILKAQPQRLSEFLAGLDAFEIALTTYAERRSTISPEDWPVVRRTLVARSLQHGDLGLAAEFWMEIPEQTRATLRGAPLAVISTCAEETGGKRCDSGDQRVSLAMGLLVAGFREEAALIPLEGSDSIFAELVSWSLTGKRTTSPWDAAIASLEQHNPRGGDFYTVLYPFIAPHFALHDIRPLLEKGFESGVSGDSGSTKILRSARARSFLRLKTLEGRLLPTAAPGAEQTKEIASALGTKDEKLKVFVNGPDHAFIVGYEAWYRTDREASGALKVTTLRRWIH